MVPHLQISWPFAPIPKQPPNVADVLGIVASCPFRLQLLLFGRDVSGLPLAARLFLLSRNCGLAFTLNLVQVSFFFVNAVAFLECVDGKRGFSVVIIICSIRIVKRARAQFDSAWHPLYIDCVGSPSTISRDCGLSDC